MIDDLEVFYELLFVVLGVDVVVGWYGKSMDGLSVVWLVCVESLGIVCWFVIFVDLVWNLVV